MWALLLPLLRKFWPHLLAVGAIIAVGLWLRHAGYESGYAASEAKWHPLFEAAERELAAANARTETKEAASKVLSEQIEKQHAETMASLNLRASAADRRIRDLSVRLAAAHSRSCPLPAVPGTTSVPDAAAEVERRAEEAGGRISSVGAACESDAATLAELQRWVTEQRAIFTDNMRPATSDR